MDIARHDDRNACIRVLDACLADLEEAVIRGTRVVTPVLAAKVGISVPNVVAGMPTTAAIDEVLEEQGRILQEPRVPANVVRGCSSEYQAPSESPMLRSGYDPQLPQLDEVTARVLTQQIRAATHHVCMLLLEAHDRRAARALGYATWGDYVYSEFHLSRSRSYELLDQARVVRALTEVAPMSGMPDISSRAAAEVKTHMDEILETVRRRASEVPPVRIPELVREVIREVRSRIKQVPGPVRDCPAVPVVAAQGDDQAVDLDIVRVVEAIECLVCLPSPKAMMAIMLDRADKFLDVARAAEWLAEFCDLWQARSPPSAAYCHAIASSSAQEKA